MSFLRPAGGGKPDCQVGYPNGVTKIRAFPCFVLGTDLVIPLGLSLPQFYQAWIYLTRGSIPAILGPSLLPETQILKEKLNYFML